VPAHDTWQIFFIFLKIFCRVPEIGTRQFFFLFFKTYFAESQTQALGNFFLFLKIIFGRVPPGPALGKALCRVPPMALGKIFFFYFGPKFFSGAL